jgi:hypothetical protein
MNKNITSNSSSLKQQFAQERLRQARWSYNLAVAATAASFCITLVGAAGLMLNRVQEGAATTAAGLVGTAYCTQLCKDSNDRVDKLLGQ